MTSSSFQHGSGGGGGGGGGNSGSGGTGGGASADHSNKKEEFRRYLEKTGVLDALTKVLVGLYEEPDRSQINALEYVKKYLGAPTGMDMEGLRRENEELKRQLWMEKKSNNNQQNNNNNTTTTTTTNE